MNKQTNKQGIRRPQHSYKGPELTYAGLPVLGQLVALVAGTKGAVGGVLAVMRTASVVFLAAVDDLHLNAWRTEQTKKHN